MAASPETRRLIGLVGSAKRYGHPHQREAERDLRASQLRDHIKAVVDAAPPLTTTQRAELAAMLTAGGAK